MLAYLLLGLFILLWIGIFILDRRRSNAYWDGWNLRLRESDDYDSAHCCIIVLGLMSIVDITILMFGLITRSPVFYFQWY